MPNRLANTFDLNRETGQVHWPALELRRDQAILFPVGKRRPAKTRDGGRV